MAKKKIEKEISKIVQKIIDVDFAEEMKDSYLGYSLEVISDRAIPNIKDGLKPVQRRGIYSTSELGVTFDKPHKKSARIVGDTMGKFHPHGKIIEIFFLNYRVKIDQNR